MSRPRKYDRDQIVKLRKEGKSYREIGKLTGCKSLSSISKTLAEVGLTNSGIRASSMAQEGVVTEVMRTKAVKMAFQSPKVLRAIFETAKGCGELFGIKAPRSEKETQRILEGLR